MARNLFLVRDGELVEMSPGDYVTEDELQSLIEQHPDLIPGAEINPAAPRRWLLVAREPGLATDDSGRDRFSIDHLMVDQEGIPTIVEVKRSTDTRIRREVVGQMFDYAANGVKYWPVARLREWLEQREGSPEAAADRVVALLEKDGDAREDLVEGFWRTVGSNLAAGRLRLLFVADSIPTELQRIIEFLNDQMQQTEVLGVAISRHRSDGLQLLAPQVYGRTESAASAKRAGDALTLAEIRAQATSATRTVGERLDVLAARLGWDARDASKSRIYSTPETGSLATWYPTYESVELYVGFMAERGLGDEVDALLATLADIRGSASSYRNPNVLCASLLDRWDDFAGSFVPAYQDARVRAGHLTRPAG
ncbi:hypothetical protein [Demequina subtropica]|uniref:hypothetical protein n=1 Tax=Demequina subtropica TaxID=1638989 RepID=UPI0007841984|nr:hypothetical protein [Demequina subtropica]